ncbi:RF-1 domain-containing protein [Chlamydoabsidia padenii]|nr:RF-1 domain-containing protein [Chlamydoabsidia padenii]
MGLLFFLYRGERDPFHFISFPPLILSLMQSILSRLYSPIKTSSTTLISGFFTRFITTPPIKPTRQKIVLKDEDLVEKFVKGSGPGGQCINKRSSCVDLRHIPTGIRVQCQQTRSLQENRGIARKLLKEKLDDLWNGSLSKNSKKSLKIAKQKARSARRAKQKYGTPKNDTGENKSE